MKLKSGYWVLFSLFPLLICFDKLLWKGFIRLSRFFYLFGDLPKVIDRHFGLMRTEIFALFLILGGYFVLRLRPSLTPPIRAYLLFILLTFLSLLFSPLSFSPLLYLRHATLLLPILLFALLQEADDSFWRRTLQVLAIGGIIQASIGITQYLLQHPLDLAFLGEQQHFSQSGAIAAPEGRRFLFDAPSSFLSLYRATGTFGHANILGTYLVASLFAILSLRGPFLPFLPLLLIALMTTFSRSAFWAFFLSVPFFFFFDKTPRKVIVFFTLASLLSFALLSPQWLLRGGIASYGEATISAASDASRMEYMDLAFNMIKAHPWWGVGFDQFPVAAGFWTPGSPGLPLVHNVFLKIGAESGLPALFAFSAFLALLFKNSLKTPWTAYFLAYLFMAMVDFHPFFLPVGRYLLIFAAGYALHRTRTPLLA